MEFKFEYNKNFTPKEYLDNRDIFRSMINNEKNSINNMDALIKSGLVDSFSVDENGIISTNLNEEKIEKLVKEWKA